MSEERWQDAQMYAERAKRYARWAIFCAGVSIALAIVTIIIAL